MLDVQSVVKHLSRELDLKQSVVEFENTKGMLSKDEINKKFMIYSIRVACALGNNKGLSEWRNDTRICQNVSLNDGFLWGGEGYWFIDRLFLTSTLDEKDVCHAANFIVNNMFKTCI